MKLKSTIKKFLPFTDIERKILNYHQRSNKMFNAKHRIVSSYYDYLIYKKYNCCISAKCELGKNISFPHPIGIAIGSGVIIGDNCVIYQNVTLGRKYRDISKYPIIGNNVIIYANSVIVGDVKIGNGAIIGCNSVVMRDVKENEVVYGIVK